MDRGFLTRYTDDKSYVNPWDEDDILLEPQNDTVRRMQLSTNITCRNLAAD